MHIYLRARIFVCMYKHLSAGVECFEEVHNYEAVRMEEVERVCCICGYMYLVFQEIWEARTEETLIWELDSVLTRKSFGPYNFHCSNN